MHRELAFKSLITEIGLPSRDIFSFCYEKESSSLFGDVLRCPLHIYLHRYDIYWEQQIYPEFDINILSKFNKWLEIFDMGVLYLSRPDI